MLNLVKYVQENKHESLHQAFWIKENFDLTIAMQPLESCITTQCPIQFVLDLISSKWTILILHELFLGDRRTHEFLDAMPGLSTKILMQRLRELEKHQIVDRRVYAEIPPHVEYSLTAKGRELQPVLAELRQLGIRWLDQDPCDCPMSLPAHVRVLRWYEKVGDRLIGEQILSPVQLTDLQQQFGVTRTDPMVECYPLTQKHITFFESLTGWTLDLEQFDYFLECDAI